MIEAWQQYQLRMTDKRSRLDENCAESMRRFLNQYAGCSIQKTGPVSFPWDVFNAAKKQITVIQAAENLARDRGDPQANKSSRMRYRVLKVSGFHEELSKLAQYADSLDRKGLNQEAEEIRSLVDQFQQKARKYQEHGNYTGFEKSCRDSVVQYGAKQSPRGSVFSTAHRSMRMLKGVTAAVVKVKDNVLDVSAGDANQPLRKQPGDDPVPPSDDPRSRL